MKVTVYSLTTNADKDIFTSVFPSSRDLQEAIFSLIGEDSRELANLMTSTDFNSPRWLQLWEIYCINSKKNGVLHAWDKHELQF